MRLKVNELFFVAEQCMLVYLCKNVEFAPLRCCFQYKVKLPTPNKQVHTEDYFYLVKVWNSIQILQDSTRGR